jgi:GR25 family glycosyltransferase involved in LPS biosynthesis
VIQAHAGSDRHLLVLEDDVAFGRTTCEVVDGFLQQNAEADWDLLFLDNCPTRIEHLLSLYFSRETLIRQRTVIPLDLEKIPFIGSNAYIVNAKAFEKVLACMDTAIPIHIEYDLFLSTCIGQGLLKAAVLFPFVTTLSQHAHASQIQRRSVDTANLARNVFRSMVWLEGSPDGLQDDMQKLDDALAGAGHEQLGKVLAGMCMTDGDPGFNSDPAEIPVNP